MSAEKVHGPRSKALLKRTLGGLAAGLALCVSADTINEIPASGVAYHEITSSDGCLDGTRYDWRNGATTRIETDAGEEVLKITAGQPDSERTNFRFPKILNVMYNPAENTLQEADAITGGTLAHLGCYDRL